MKGQTRTLGGPAPSMHVADHCTTAHHFLMRELARTANQGIKRMLHFLARYVALFDMDSVGGGRGVEDA